MHACACLYIEGVLLWPASHTGTFELMWQALVSVSHLHFRVGSWSATVVQVCTCLWLLGPGDTRACDYVLKTAFLLGMSTRTQSLRS